MRLSSLRVCNSSLLVPHGVHRLITSIQIFAVTGIRPAQLKLMPCIIAWLSRRGSAKCNRCINIFVGASFKIYCSNYVIRNKRWHFWFYGNFNKLNGLFQHEGGYKLFLCAILTGSDFKVSFRNLFVEQFLYFVWSFLDSIHLSTFYEFQRYNKRQVFSFDF